jgi:hypothetical protein
MKTVLGLAIVGFFIAAAPCALAQNLIANPDFDSDVSGWNPLGENLTIEWSASDYDGNPSSGSLLGTNTAAPSANLAVDQCVGSITPGESYRFAGWVKAPSGQTSTGIVQMYWYWRSSPSCGGTQTLAQSTSWANEADDWTYLSTNTEIAPEGAVSAQVALSIYKTSPVPGTFQAFYDGIDFRKTGIFSDGFELGTTQLWSATVP